MSYSREEEDRNVSGAGGLGNSFLARRRNIELRRRIPRALENPNPTIGSSFFGKDKWKEEEMRSPLLQKSKRKIVEGPPMDRGALIARIAELENQIHKYQYNMGSSAKKKRDESRQRFRLEAEKNLKREQDKFEKEKQEYQLRKKELDEDEDDFVKVVDLTHSMHELERGVALQYTKLRNQFLCMVDQFEYCFVCGAFLDQFAAYVREVKLLKWEYRGPVLEAAKTLSREIREAFPLKGEVNSTGIAAEGVEENNASLCRSLWGKLQNILNIS